MFIPNPEFQGLITPFHSGIMQQYLVEYNLEIARENLFPNYPSRLNSIYLFLSEQEALQYKFDHEEHVKDRVLKKCYSVTPCIYSTHDASWIDFLRLPHAVEKQSLDIIAKAYWAGKKAEDFPLESLDKLWAQKPIIEVLFIGRVEFYDKRL